MHVSMKPSYLWFLLGSLNYFVLCRHGWYAAACVLSNVCGLQRSQICSFGGVVIFSYSRLLLELGHFRNNFSGPCFCYHIVGQSLILPNWQTPFQNSVYCKIYNLELLRVTNKFWTSSKLLFFVLPFRFWCFPFTYLSTACGQDSWFYLSWLSYILSLGVPKMVPAIVFFFLRFWGTWKLLFDVELLILISIRF